MRRKMFDFNHDGKVSGFERYLAYKMMESAAEKEEETHYRGDWEEDTDEEDEDDWDEEDEDDEDDWDTETDEDDEDDWDTDTDEDDEDDWDTNTDDAPIFYADWQRKYPADAYPLDLKARDFDREEDFIAAWSRAAIAYQRNLTVQLGGEWQRGWDDCLEYGPLGTKPADTKPDGTDEWQRGRNAGYKDGWDKGCNDGWNACLDYYSIDAKRIDTKRTDTKPNGTDEWEAGWEAGCKDGWDDGWKAGQQEGWDNGWKGGWEEGCAFSWEEGYEAGLAKGREAGLAEGRKKGRLSGRAEGWRIGCKYGRKIWKEKGYQKAWDDIYHYRKAVDYLQTAVEGLLHKLDPLLPDEDAAEPSPEGETK